MADPHWCCVHPVGRLAGTQLAYSRRHRQRLPACAPSDLLSSSTPPVFHTSCNSSALVYARCWRCAKCQSRRLGAFTRPLASSVSDATFTCCSASLWQVVMVSVARCAGDSSIPTNAGATAGDVRQSTLQEQDRYKRLCPTPNAASALAREASCDTAPWSLTKLGLHRQLLGACSHRASGCQDAWQA